MYEYVYEYGKNRSENTLPHVLLHVLVHANLHHLEQAIARRHNRLKSLDSAKRINGVRAAFGEE